MTHTTHLIQTSPDEAEIHCDDCDWCIAVQVTDGMVRLDLGRIRVSWGDVTVHHEFTAVPDGAKLNVSGGVNEH